MAFWYVLDLLQYRKVESLRQTLEVNVVGVHAMIQAFLPLLQAGHKKTVINISSGSGSLSRRYEEVIITHIMLLLNSHGQRHWL
jgi:NADP-dependent 3-hydroxy acid dehydrogenase YdfG